jgi:hypothetical protein
MSDALHRGIPYGLEEVRSGEWRWSFDPPEGPPHAGRVKGQSHYATTVVRRAIEVWLLMNRNHTATKKPAAEAPVVPERVRLKTTVEHPEGTGPRAAA